MKQKIGDVVMIATRNQGKLREFKQMFSQWNIQVKSLLDEPQLPDVIEDGETFLDNAIKKAVEIAKQLQISVLADDSGLCVDALDGAPGVYSARYAGEECNDANNNEKLIRELEKVTKMMESDDEQQQLLSPAQFVCVLVLYNPNTGEQIDVTGTCEGWIKKHPAGDGGFGYDPHFYIRELDKTMAELTADEKNKVSHRGQAIRLLSDALS